MNKKNIGTILMLLVLTLTFSVGTFAENEYSNIDIELINQDPDPAYPGDIVELRIGIENTGLKTVDNLILELQDEYPFEIVSDKTIETGIINAYQIDEEQKVVKIKIKIDKDTTSGSYPLELNYYEEGSKTSNSVELNIDIQSKNKLEITNIDNEVINPGQTTDVTYTLENKGENKLTNIEFSWENKDGLILPVGQDNSIIIDSLNSNEIKEITFKIKADSNANPGLYKIENTILFSENSGTQKLETTSGLYIGGSTEFDISVSNVEGQEYTFALANIGLNPANSVIVSVPKQSSWMTLSQDKNVIGDLSTGDYTIVSFQLQNKNMNITKNMNRDDTELKQNFRRDINKENILKINVEYTDTQGNRIIEEKELEINPNYKSTSSENRIPGNGKFQQKNQSLWDKYKIPIIAFGLVAIFIYFKKRKQHKVSQK